MTNVRSPQRNTRPPIVVGAEARVRCPRRRSSDGRQRLGSDAPGVGAASPGSSRSARVVDEDRPDRPDEVERAGDDDRAGRLAPAARSRAASTGRTTDAAATPGAPRPTSPPRGRSAGSARGRSTCGADDAGRAGDRRRGERARARRRRPCRPSTRGRASAGAAPARRRPGGTGAGRRAPGARAAAPAGLWAPSRRTSRTAAGVPSRLEQLEPARPAGRGVARAGEPPAPTVAIPAASRASSTASATADVRRLVPAAQPDPRLAEAAAARRRCRRGPSRSTARRGRPRSAATPSRRARRRMTAERVAGRAGHGQVAALDDRGLLAGDRRRPSARAGPCGRGRRS